MPIRLVLTALFLSVTLLITGCFGGKETDDVAYVLVIGIDANDDGNLKITYQIANPKGGGAASGGEGGSATGMGEKGGGSQSWIINTITAPTPAETRMLLNSSMSRFPNVGHTSAIIIGESMARNGIGYLLSFFVRNREFRETTLLIVVAGTAEDFIRHTKPSMDATITKFYETFTTSLAESSFSFRTDLHQFYTRLKNQGGSPFIMYSGTNPKTGEDRPAESKTPQQKGEAYLPGGIPRTGTESSAEFLGLALFRGDKMVGVLNSDQTRAVAILQGNFFRGIIGVVDPLDAKESVSLVIRNGGKPRITADFSGRAPVFTASVPIEAEILGITSGINYEADSYRELLESQVSQMLTGQIRSMVKHTQELGSDPVGFGMHLRPKFPNYDALKQADLTTLYQAADIQISVTTKIRRTGLIWRTSPAQQN
ncbi:MAG TPA: Ger(x)C family spore germination protein [Methylomusa anaerophila]|uniref:Spore germination protein B3 n=1 Tax=Methylomusa anaerophila TaxID=1930071 RepID=A0A348AGZ1_9FIRM|nr:Ger(x)C family spore germination protein [Methylomusa anaerophila]BBB90339.1 spore germination protein B3 precursor [Methylomusa anaerophila]HML89315.1 Ger(x)C family spore germination protein [Methylomusa anaerophila]